MATSLYLASLEPSSGKSLVALGLMELLSRRVDRLGYFRPVIPSDDESDSRIELMSRRVPRSWRSTATTTPTSATNRTRLA